MKRFLWILTILSIVGILQQVRQVSSSSSDDNEAPAAATVEAFLATNRHEPDVTELPSGLQYRIVVNGTGTWHPQPMCACLVHYQGRILHHLGRDDNDNVFDSSYQRGPEPFRVAPHQVMDGWAEAMQIMVQGDKWQLFVPPDLGYGEQGQLPDIPANALLMFDLEMIALDCDDIYQVPALKCRVTTGQGCSDREASYITKIQTLSSSSSSSFWTADKISRELQRLDRVLNAGTPIKVELQEWVIRRQYILQQQFLLVSSSSSASVQEEQDEL